MADRRTFILGMGSSLLLAACSPALAPVTFDLSPARPQPVERRSSRTVVITLPKAVATYDSERVVVRQAGGILSYLPEAQYSDRLPKLLQTRLLQAFEFAAFRNVGRPDDQLEVDLTLATEVLAFEIDVSAGGIASVALSAKLVDERRRSIASSTVFSAQLPATADTAAGAIAGLDSALNDVSQQMVAWTARNA